MVPGMGSSSWEFGDLLGACPAPGTHCRGERWRILPWGVPT